MAPLRPGNIVTVGAIVDCGLSSPGSLRPLRLRRPSPSPHHLRRRRSAGSTGRRCISAPKGTDVLKGPCAGRRRIHAVYATRRRRTRRPCARCPGRSFRPRPARLLPLTPVSWVEAPVRPRPSPDGSRRRKPRRSQTARRHTSRTPQLRAAPASGPSRPPTASLAGRPPSTPTSAEPDVAPPSRDASNRFLRPDGRADVRSGQGGDELGA